MNGGAAGPASAWATSSLPRSPAPGSIGSPSSGVIEVAALAALAAYVVWRYVLHRPIVATTPLPFGLFLAPAIWAGWLAEAALARYPF